MRWRVQLDMYPASSRLCLTAQASPEAVLNMEAFPATTMDVIHVDEPLWIRTMIRRILQSSLWDSCARMSQDEDSEPAASREGDHDDTGRWVPLKLHRLERPHFGKSSVTFHSISPSSSRPTTRLGCTVQQICRLRESLNSYSPETW